MEFTRWLGHKPRRLVNQVAFTIGDVLFEDTRLPGQLESTDRAFIPKPLTPDGLTDTFN